MTTERVVPVRARDGFEMNLINVRGSGRPEKGPVLLVHGAGVRANIFRAPSGRTLVDSLLDRPALNAETGDRRLHSRRHADPGNL